MEILPIISLNNCFVSIRVVVRFTYAYRDFVADNDYAIFIQIPGLFKLERRVPYVARAEEQVLH